MRYPASEKLEIIRLVEQSHLGVGSTLDKLGIPKTTFYRWYDRFPAFGDAGLEDRNSSPGRVWNRIPDDVRGQIIDLALEETQLSPRELAVRFTDTRGYFVSEASVYRLLKAHDLITSPAFVVIKAADEFRDKTTAPNQLWHSPISRSSAGCQWRSKKGPPRRCKKGPLGGCGLVPVVHGRAPRTTRRALNRLTRRRAREGPVGPRGQAWAGWSVQLAVGV